MVHHVSLRDCTFAEPTHPINSPFRCSGIDDGCPALVTYDRNTTIPSPALAAEAGAAWPFGRNHSRYWVRGRL